MQWQFTKCTKRDNPHLQRGSVMRASANYVNDDELQQSSLMLISTLHAGVAQQKCTRLNGASEWAYLLGELSKGHSEAFMCFDCYLPLSLSRSIEMHGLLPHRLKVVCFAFFRLASLQCETWLARNQKRQNYTSLCSRHVLYPLLITHAKRK